MSLGCPWARYRTPNCFQCSGWHLAWQPPPSAYVHMNYCNCQLTLYQMHLYGELFSTAPSVWLTLFFCGTSPCLIFNQPSGNRYCALMPCFFLFVFFYPWWSFQFSRVLTDMRKHLNVKGVFYHQCFLFFSNVMNSAEKVKQSLHWLPSGFLSVLPGIWSYPLSTTLPVNLWVDLCVPDCQTSLTWVFVHPLLHGVVFLMHPLAVALEVNLRGGRRLAVEIDGFVLDDVAFFGFEQEVR